MNLKAFVFEPLLAFGQPKTERPRDLCFYGGLQVIHADGAMGVRLTEAGRGTQTEGAAQHTRIAYRDEAYPLCVTKHVVCYEDCAAVETWLEIRHGEPGPLRLVRMDSFSAELPEAQATVKVLSLAGEWACENNLHEAEVVPGQTVELSSRAGTRSAWESNAAFMLSLEAEVTERTGEVLGVALAWSGTASRRIRRTWDARTQLFVGVDNAGGPYVLDAGRTLVLPKAVLVHSNRGKGEVSRQFHRWARRHCLPHGGALHPVLLNSWEGSYFSFDEKVLSDMMDGLRAMDGELFVLDDGWFGQGDLARDDRNRDTAGLGDWSVNRAKLPRGLSGLAAEARRRGLGFGLWVEPEMANTRSALAQAHPDWILQEPNRPLLLGRGGTQVVLDYTNPAVREAVFRQLEKAYAEVPDLAFIKWDCNEHLANIGSTYLARDRQANLWFDYTCGLYDLLARFQAQRPHVTTQACASGGAHMDFGFLRYADEFWTSDNTDPLRRVFIQWGALQFYPACAMACHVTESPNHDTKRETPLKYRFDVAMSGRLGFELRPSRLTPEEVAYARARVAQYKRIRAVVQQGDLYRLASPYEHPFAALMYVSEDRSRAVVFLYGLDRPLDLSGWLPLDGLDPEGTYRAAGRTYAGCALMDAGLPYALSGTYASDVVELVRA